MQYVFGASAAEFSLFESQNCTLYDTFHDTCADMICAYNLCPGMISSTPALNRHLQAYQLKSNWKGWSWGTQLVCFSSSSSLCHLKIHWTDQWQSLPYWLHKNEMIKFFSVNNYIPSRWTIQYSVTECRWFNVSQDFMVHQGWLKAHLAQLSEDQILKPKTAPYWQTKTFYCFRHKCLVLGFIMKECWCKMRTCRLLRNNNDPFVFIM